MSNSMLISFAVPWEFVWNFMPSTLILYTHKNTRRLPRAALYRWFFHTKKMVFYRGQSYGSRCGTVCGYGLRLNILVPQVVLLVGAVGPKFRHTLRVDTPILGGGNPNIFYFHPYLGKIPILTNMFQINGLKPPTSIPTGYKRIPFIVGERGEIAWCSRSGCVVIFTE